MIFELGKKYRLVYLNAPNIDRGDNNHIFQVISLDNCIKANDLTDPTRKDVILGIDEAKSNFKWELVEENTKLLVPRNRFDLILE